MSCCEHCPLPKDPLSLEDAAFAGSMRALRRETAVRITAKPLKVTTTVHITHGRIDAGHFPRFQPPSDPDPYRPRGS